tara:strand:+ start:295 stop:618 length:324 start_codon:yes stop_codon:yes gene_type:complete
MKNEKVVTEWINGRSAENRTLKSNGVQLFSYALKIAEHVPFTDSPTIWDYTAHGDFVSATTSKHVGLVRGVLARASMDSVLVNPKPRTLLDDSIASIVESFNHNFNA